MSRAYRWLALLPAVGILGGVFFANRVHHRAPLPGSAPLSAAERRIRKREHVARS